MRIGLVAATALLATCLPVPAGHASLSPGFVSPAHAAARPDRCAADSDRQIAAQLARHPGGTRVDSNTVSYDGGALSVNVFPSTCASFDGMGDCDSGVACFWQRSRYRGTQWVLSGKDRWVGLRAGRFGSAHNNDHGGDLLLRGARDGATVKVFGPDTGSPDTLPSGARSPVGELGWACLSTRGSGGCT
ncbi:peptidase inhibitor family I36 protein [Nonomuraea sp. NPDC059194]|uniref:peptidase inhibitor family I36 protein n=1 Tax=Nonomuraea sp. NPDC059194 TaxID=3346764 RepID=UPI0036789286